MDCIVGIDSGGSTTRALAVGLAGEPLGYAEAGGGNPTHDQAARANVRAALAGAMAGRVVRVVAGVAGMSGQEDWAPEVTDVPGLEAVRVHLNDADVAHHAAFGGGPGILSVQGTGSTVFAVLESGERVRNGDLGHYAGGGAVVLGQRAVYAALSGATLGFADAVAAAVGTDLDGLRRRMRAGWDGDFRAKSAAMGRVARVVTARAEAGDMEAVGLCRKGAEEIVEGIRLLGALFALPEVGVAFVGACVRSPAVRRGVETLLLSATERTYRIVEPRMPPVVGAVLMALEGEGVALDDAAVTRLGEHVSRGSSGRSPSPATGA